MEQKQKKIPERQCLGCNGHFPKGTLLRVVRSPQGEDGYTVTLDFTGKKSGRGAYICASPDCLKTAHQRKGLERSLKVAIPTEVYESLEQEMRKIAK